jgi:hypothetical protein
MNTLRLLFAKDVRIIVNTYFRTRRQALGSLLVVGALLAGVVLIARAIGASVRGVAEALPGFDLAATLPAIVPYTFAFGTLAAVMFVVGDSKRLLFGAEELSLLAVTPVPSSLVFVWNFMRSVWLAPLAILQAVFMLIGPLWAAPMLLGRGWETYAWLALIALVYQAIPAALAVLLADFLYRKFTAAQVTRVITAGNLLLNIIWFAFILAPDRLATILALAGGVGNAILAAARSFPPLLAAQNLVLMALGVRGLSFWPFLVLAVSLLGTGWLVIAVVQRSYYLHYERLQVSHDPATQARKTPKHAWQVGLGQTQSLFSFLVYSHWKTAFRNREMAQGSLFFLGQSIVYAMLVERFVPNPSPWVMLVNVLLAGMCAGFATSILFVPFEQHLDMSVVNRQFWLAKLAPIPASVYIAAQLVASIPPAVALGVVLLIVINYFTGITGLLALASYMLLVGLLVSSSLIGHVSLLLSAAHIGESVRLAVNLVMNVLPLVYPLLPVLIAGIGWYYDLVGIFHFMRQWTELSRVSFAMSLALVLMVAVTYSAWRTSLRLWELLEIR